MLRSRPAPFSSRFHCGERNSRHRVTDETHYRLIAESGGERLDAFLATHLPQFSRSRAAQLIEQGVVRINERVPKKSEKVAAGDVVSVLVPAARDTTVG